MKKAKKPKLKPLSKVGKRSVGLNKSVSTYGKSTIRILNQANKDWLEIQPKENLLKKGIFSDSDDSFASFQNVELVKKKTVHLKKNVRKSPVVKKVFPIKSPTKENEDPKLESFSSSGESNIIKTSIIEPWIAVNQSKAKNITRGRRRRPDYKVTNGLSTFSFSEHQQLNAEISFGSSILNCHNEILNDSLHLTNTDKANDLVQSTPMNCKRRSFIFTPASLNKNISLKSWGTPIFGMTTRQQAGNLEMKQFHLSFEKALSPKRLSTDVGLSWKERVLVQCNQTEPCQFEDVFLSRKALVKIGEGVYGEVYRSRSKKGDPLAIKVIPIEGETVLNGEKQKSFQEILPEIVNSIELSNLEKGFIKLHSVRLVQGKYPDFLLAAWDEFDLAKGSENDRPELCQEDQLYVVLLFADGGSDVEHYTFTHAGQALSVVQQTVCALAQAEESLQFEHRDLHWGNILVKKDPALKSESFSLDGTTHSVSLRGLGVNIIDFTLSRMTKDELTLYQDLSEDESLFVGDAEVDYQFEVYRLMRSETNDNWSLFRPKTNVFWVHYLLDKFLNEVKYKQRSAKLHKSSIVKLRKFHQSVLTFQSCREIFNKSSFFS